MGNHGLDVEWNRSVRGSKRRLWSWLLLHRKNLILRRRLLVLSVHAQSPFIGFRVVFDDLRVASACVLDGAFVTLIDGGGGLVIRLNVRPYNLSCMVSHRAREEHNGENSLDLRKVPRLRAAAQEQPRF